MVDKLYIIRPVVTFDNARYKKELEEKVAMSYDIKKMFEYIKIQHPDVYKNMEDEIADAKETYYLEQQAYHNFTGTKKEAIEQANKKWYEWLERPEEYFDIAIRELDAVGRLSEYQKGKKVTVNGNKLSIKQFRRLKEQLADYYVKIENNTTKQGRNNIIFDTLWSMLTSELVMDLIFTPGNFDEPKKYGYMAEALRLHPKLSYEEIESIYNNEGVDGLKNLISKSKNLVYNNVHLAFHKLNMVAGKLIGIFALNNVSHSIISLIDLTAKTDSRGNIEYNPNGTPKLNKPTIYVENNILNIEGNLIGGGEYLYVPFDTLEDKLGRRISNTLAAFLAASVDAVKDPVLNYMNVNETTAGILVTLLRMGYDTELAMLFLSQPIIKDTINSYIIANESEKVFLNNWIDKRLEALIQRFDSGLNINGIGIPTLDRQTLKNNLRGIIGGTEDDRLRTEINLLLALKELNNLSDITSSIVTLTRFNSVTSAAGPMYSDTILLKNKVIEAFQLPEIDNSISMLEALNNPIIATFRNVEFKAVDALFDGMMLQASPTFSYLCSRVMAITGRKIDAAMINRLSDFYLAFILAKGDNPVFKTDDTDAVTSEKRRKYIYKLFPLEVKELKKTSNNKLLLKIRIMPKDDSHECFWLKMETRGMSSEVHDDFGLSWIELYLENPTVAMNLIEYNFITSGLGFAPNSFANLVPVALKTIIPNYVHKLTQDTELNVVEEERLIELFVRNNHNDYLLVYTLSAKNIKNKYKYKKSVITLKQDGGILIDSRVTEILRAIEIYRDYIQYKDKLYKFIKVSGSLVEYAEVSKLGGKYGEILEINPSGEVTPIDLSIGKDKESSKTAKKAVQKSKKGKEEDVENSFDVEIQEEAARGDILDDRTKAAIAQVLNILLNAIPEEQLNDRMNRLIRANTKSVKDKDSSAPKNALRSLFRDYSDSKYNQEAFEEIPDYSKVIWNATKYLHEKDPDKLRKVVLDINDDYKIYCS